MSSSTIQIQLEKKELTKAHELAKAWGFSSVEEVLKAFLKQLPVPSRSAESIKLTEKSKKHYKQMNDDFKTGGNVHVAKSVDDFLAQLDA